MKLGWTPVLALWLVSSAGCDRSPPASTAPAPPPVASAPAPLPTATTTTTEPTTATTAAETDAQGELDRLDPRRPVPLLPMMAWHQKQNMQEHLVAIQRITDALAREDWDEVRAAAASIGTSPEMQRMCKHMGAGAEGFTSLALDFHAHADRIGEAAATKDVATVLRATSSTLQTCVGCHATYRQQVVDAEAWRRLTGAVELPSHGPGR